MDEVKKLFKKLNAFEELYLVGGSVRDLLLNRPVQDYDFCVPYTPSIIKEKLKECGITNTFDVGQKFGTIGCQIESLAVEITTFRGEQYNFVDRKPEVSYIDKIQEDVKRRDFTINAIYISRKEVESNDSDISSLSFRDDDGRQSKLQDLNNRVITTVGNAGLRFREDPLRMLRAIRLASQLDFTIEKKTMAMIIRMRVELLKVSRERWTQELDKLLSCEKVNFNILKESQLLSIIIPELSYQIDFDQNSNFHNLSLWEHTAKVVNAVPCDNLNLRWAGLLHDIGKPFVKVENKKGKYNYMGHELMGAFMVDRIGGNLKWSKERTKSVSDIVKTHLEEYNTLREYDHLGKE